MADRLRITELDFDTIKTNLKTFLKQQSEFTDYDFDGSGLSVLLDILAYNTHYQAYYLNMVANEAFLDTALLRDSVVSHAKTLGYTPFSKSASAANIRFEVFANDNTPGTLTVPSGYNFLSNQIDGKVYNFVVLNDVTVTKADSSFVFDDLLIYEGQLTSYRYVYDESSNPKQIFEIPDDSIDTQTIKVSVSPSVSNTQSTVYTASSDVYELNGTSKVFFLQESRNGLYQVYFGDGVIGQKLGDGNVVTITYLVTNGSLANQADNFTAVRALNGYTNFDITVNNVATGGDDRETVDSIKYLAPLQYASQNRIVTKKDYELFLKKTYTSLDSVAVWGGEEEVPPVYGKVFVSLKPKSGFYISETEQQKIIDDVISQRAMLTVSTEIREPDYLYLITNTTVQYDPSKTLLSKDGFKNLIRNAILLYKNSSLDSFASKFVLSKIEESVNDADLYSIVGSSMNIKLQKRFVPTFNQTNNYTIDFGTPLTQMIQANRLKSSEFDVFDVNGVRRTVTIEEVPKSITGINQIDIVNPGVGYTSKPVITITGDGLGATAEAIVINGRVENIKILTPGTDYTTATVTITGGGGIGAIATPILDYKTGTLRTVFFNASSERQIVNPSVGLIDYDSGIITMNDLNIVSTNTSDQLIRIDCAPAESIIEGKRNTIITIDEQDPVSIVINLMVV